jgi:peptide-methionine (S)-S-oxide reductase
VTDVASSQTFYAAEAYHQDYFTKHPHDPYIMINDRPKVDALKRQFPELYVERQ